MARLRLAPFLEGMSGRMGGVVYKLTKFGTEMANFEAPSNPQTDSQNAVRNSFRKATQQWRTLTANQAEAWRTYASERYHEEEITEQRYRSTGFNAFVALACKWFAVNPNQATAPASPPATPYGGDTITVVPDAETPGVITFTASGANNASSTTALLVQKLSGPNSEPTPGAYTIKKYFKFEVGTLATDVTVAPGYYAVAYQFVNTSTGQMTGIHYVEGIVGPVGFAMVEGGRSSSKQKKAA